MLVIIDDDRIYNKNVIKNFVTAHNSYPSVKFITGLWTTYFDKNYKAMHPDYLDIHLKKEINNNKITYGDGVGGFYGFCLNIIDNEFDDFIKYNHTILNKIKKSCFHDEGIILGYIKVKEEHILYLKHIGCYFINMKEPDALWKSNLVDRKNAGVDNATNGVPAPVDIIPFKESKNSTILSSIDAKVVIVLSPNKTGSVAFLEPNNTLPD